MGNFSLAVRNINHKYIVAGKEKYYGKFYVLCTDVFCFWERDREGNRKVCETVWRDEGDDPLWRWFGGAVGTA